MTILPYKLDTTNDLLTSRAGLLTTDQLMASLSLAERIDQHFPQPKSNRGFKPSKILKTFILMQHEGSFHLDDVRHLNNRGQSKVKCARLTSTQGLGRKSPCLQGPKRCGRPSG